MADNEIIESLIDDLIGAVQACKRTPMGIKTEARRNVVEFRAALLTKITRNKTLNLYNVNNTVECDIKITIASDTAIKVEECFKAVDAALDIVLYHHYGVEITMRCETRVIP